MTATEDPAQDNQPAVQVQLPQDQRAPGQARRVTREALTSWRLPHLVDAVMLAVSELVTNAVRHGRPPVSMHLEYQAEQVRLAVHDGNPAEPPAALAGAGPEDGPGRGLAIVQAVADDVHVEQVPDDGKILHATFNRQTDTP